MVTGIGLVVLGRSRRSCVAALVAGSVSATFVVGVRHSYCLCPWPWPGLTGRFVPFPRSVDAHMEPGKLLGPLHGGWGVATSVLADERAGVASTRAGLKRQTASIRRLASNGQDSPAAAQAMTIETDAGAIGHLFARVGGDPGLGPLSKLGLTELASRVTETQLGLQGAHGMLVGDATEVFLYAPGCAWLAEPVKSSGTW